MTEDELPGPLAEGRVCRDRGARGGQKSETETDDERERKSKEASRQGSARMAMREAVGRTRFGATAGACWEMLDGWEAKGSRWDAWRCRARRLIGPLCVSWHPSCCCRMAWTTQIGRGLGPFRGGHGLAGGCDCVRMGLRHDANAMHCQLICLSRPLATRQPRAPSSLFESLARTVWLPRFPYGCMPCMYACVCAATQRGKREHEGESVSVSVLCGPVQSSPVQSGQPNAASQAVCMDGCIASPSFVPSLSHVVTVLVRARQGKVAMDPGRIDCHSS